MYSCFRCFVKRFLRECVSLRFSLCLPLKGEVNLVQMLVNDSTCLLHLLALQQRRLWKDCLETRMHDLHSLAIVHRFHRSKRPQTLFLQMKTASMCSPHESLLSVKHWATTQIAPLVKKTTFPRAFIKLLSPLNVCSHLLYLSFLALIDVVQISNE